LRVEVADQGFRGLGGWDGQDAADGFGGLGVVGQGVCEEDADRAEAGVAGGGRVGPLAGEVVEEAGDGVAVDVFEPDLVCGGRGGRADVFDQEAPGVAVGGDRVGGEVALDVDVVGEERLQCAGEVWAAG